MSFWIAAAILAFIAALSVVLPLVRRPGRLRGVLEYDKAMYQARLEEIGRDRDMGRLTGEEAEAAIAEEGRKLIALAAVQPRADSSATAGADTHGRYRILAIIVFLLVPFSALGLYLPVGNPSLPDLSLASRLQEDPSGQSITELVARAENHLASNPDDATGWQVVAPVYMRLGRFDDAVKAWSNVLRIEPETPGIRSTIAEAMMAASGGVVTANARQLFQEEVELEPDSMKPRFYLAVALGQEGRHAEAVEAWQALLDDSPADAPWVEPARGLLASSAREIGLDPENLQQDDAPTVEPGPTREQVEQAAEMSAEDRMVMIQGMVSGLADRLAEDPSDKQGWLRLVRAYGVLGDAEKADAAIRTALDHHGADMQFAAAIDELRDELAGGGDKSQSPDTQ